jgi:hypothetical protein
MKPQRDMYGVLVLVEAESSHLAREAVVAELTEKAMAGSYGFSLPFLEPVQVGTEDGKAIIQKYWNTYMEQGIKDVSIVLDEIKTADVLTFPLEEQIEGGIRVLLESWAFRAACVRIGTIDSWPIRIYHLGIGINNESILNTVLYEEPGLWVIEALLE